jgi:single-strand DNA-binding protein
MASFNKVILVGNLTRDPEVRFLGDGTAVADLGLAVNETFRNKAGELVEQTCFVDVVVWARQAETCGKYLSKGSPALIEGRLQLDQWTTKEGEKRSKLRVRADRVQFLGAPQRGTEFSDGGGAPAGGPSRGRREEPPERAQPRDEAPPEQGDEGPVGDTGDEDNLPF